MSVFPQITLSPRLSLAYDLYDKCDLAADIGTDHAHLPAALLQRGRCQHMILTDVSPSALSKARSEMSRFRLTDRVDFRLGDGLRPLKESCGMISVTGMGGQTIRKILMSGSGNLGGASLILSAHTDWHLIRSAIMDIGYHLDREEPCFDAGRYYLIIRARPGTAKMSLQEIRLGSLLFCSASPILRSFLLRRREILSVQLSGLKSAVHQNVALIGQLQDDIDFLDQKINRHQNQEDYL